MQNDTNRMELKHYSTEVLYLTDDGNEASAIHEIIYAETNQNSKYSYISFIYMWNNEKWQLVFSKENVTEFVLRPSLESLDLWPKTRSERCEIDCISPISGLEYIKEWWVKNKVFIRNPIKHKEFSDFLIDIEPKIMAIQKEYETNKCRIKLSEEIM